MPGKGIYCALIVAGCALLGRLLSRKYRNRTRRLQQLSDRFAHMGSLFAYDAPVLDELMDRVAGNDELTPFLRAFQEALRAPENGVRDAWQNAVTRQESGALAALTTDDRQLIRGFGELLEQVDRLGLRGHCQLIRERLEGQLTQAQAEQLKYEKLYGTLGILGGCLIVVLLL